MTLNKLSVTCVWLLILSACATTTPIPTTIPATTTIMPVPTNVVPPTATATTRPAPTSTPLPTETPLPTKSFRIIGYAADWEGQLNPAQLPHLTHVNYAFLLPNADGSVNGMAPVS